MSRKRQLAAIMFTDIAGYTALMQQNEKKAIQTRNKHRHVFNSATKKYKGRILQYYGDGTLSVFSSVIDSVKCAIEMQQNFQKHPSVPVRIGIHSGDIFFSEEEIIGDSVNIASRIESLAVPGSVFISDKVYDEIKNQEFIKTSPLKSFKLKNVEKPIELYAIANEGLIVPEADEIETRSGTDSQEKTTDSKKDLLEKPVKYPPSTLLTTKLYIPPPRSNVIRRERLIKCLNYSLNSALTLISAPAGFGKTTLVGDWISNNNKPVAWLSLDEGDNDSIRFLTYLIAAFQTVKKNLGDGAMGLLQSPQPAPAESVLTSLLNDISRYTDNIFLVLDDYHVIHERSVNDSLTFLLDHMPPCLHLIITARHDPDLPIARLRVRNQLTEIGPQDLRFTSSEAAGFLEEVMGLKLSPEEIDTLENRTEGWIAGLQLAAISMQGRDDIAGFIRSFAGQERYIVDYLGDEVLKGQSEEIRKFLLYTSILKRLNAPLCDSVTGQKNSGMLLDELERANLFIIPLDNERHWFRFHNLFAEFLYGHLLKEEPEIKTVLHQRASVWYEQNGSPAEAIRHALAAKDLERAANLIEQEWPAMDATFQLATWIGWVKEIPDELIRVRPVLNVGYAWALIGSGELELGESRLKDAAQVLENMGKKDGESQSETEVVIQDNDQFQDLPASIAGAHAYIASARGDVSRTVEYARRALDLIPEKDSVKRGTAASLMGLAYWSDGKLEAAYNAFAEGRDIFKNAGNILFAISSTIGLADIRILQGRLQDALQKYRQAIELGKSQGEFLPRGVADMYTGLGKVCCELGDLEAAKDSLKKSEELGESAGLPDWRYRFCLAQCRLKEVEGDLDACIKFLDEAEKLYFRTPLPNIRSISALRTKLWLKQDKWEKILDWIQKQDLSIDGEINFLNEYDHMILCRVLIARYYKEKKNDSILGAIQLLERLFITAEKDGRTGSLIEILIIKAMAHKAQDNIPEALKHLKDALDLAEPEGYIYIFVDEGFPLQELFFEAIDQDIAVDYINNIMRYFQNK
jgi:LuxR family maltose regulon positive regulatory protein